jgi:hypothetical protein
MRILRGQRNRWHRGLWETLWAHRGMLFKGGLSRYTRALAAHGGDHVLDSGA